MSTEKWINWLPGMEQGVFKQLLDVAGERSSIVWMVEPPPYLRVVLTPLDIEAVTHFMAEGGVPIGWISPKAECHGFKLQPPYEPPNFRVMFVDGKERGYTFRFTDAYVQDMALTILQQNREVKYDA